MFWVLPFVIFKFHEARKSESLSFSCSFVIPQNMVKSERRQLVLFPFIYYKLQHIYNIKYNSKYVVEQAFVFWVLTFVTFKFHKARKSASLRFSCSFVMPQNIVKPINS